MEWKCPLAPALGALIAIQLTEDSGRCIDKSPKFDQFILLFMFFYCILILLDISEAWSVHGAKLSTWSLNHMQSSPSS